MKKTLLLGLLIGYLGGCASSAEMMDLEPVAEFEAKADLPEFRDCLFRWSSSRANSLEYHPDGIFVKDAVNAPLYLIVRQNERVSVFVHWNMSGSEEVPVYMAGRCNDEPTARPSEDLWSFFFETSELPNYRSYVPQD